MAKPDEARHGPPRVGRELTRRDPEVGQNLVEEVLAVARFAAETGLQRERVHTYGPRRRWRAHVPICLGRAHCEALGEDDAVPTAERVHLVLRAQR
jgi:hypothetical protein